MNKINILIIIILILAQNVLTTEECQNTTTQSETPQPIPLKLTYNTASFGRAIWHYIIDLL